MKSHNFIVIRFNFIMVGSLFFRIFKFFFILFCFINFTTQIKIKSKDDKFFNEDPDMVDSNRAPIVNIHMEDYDSDPVNFKRFDGERKSYLLRVNEMHERYENDKKALMDVIALQQSKIAHLTDIAEYINNAVEFYLPRPTQVEESGNRRKDYTGSSPP